MTQTNTRKSVSLLTRTLPTFCMTHIRLGFRFVLFWIPRLPDFQTSLVLPAANKLSDLGLTPLPNASKDQICHKEPLLWHMSVRPWNVMLNRHCPKHVHWQFRHLICFIWVGSTEASDFQNPLNSGGSTYACCKTSNTFSRTVKERKDAVLDMMWW